MGKSETAVEEKEWIELIKQARDLGISKDEVLRFVAQMQQTEE